MIESGKLLIGGFMVILIGLVLIVPIGNQVALTEVSSRTISNESVTLSSNQGYLKYDELTAAATACRNSTMNAILLGTHCNVSQTSGLVTVGSNFSTNLAYIDYTYEPDDYVSSATTRTLNRLVIMFFALGILSVGIGLVYKGLKDNNIL